MKIKYSYSLKGTVKRMKKQPKTENKIVVDHMSDKRLIDLKWMGLRDPFPILSF